MSNDSISWKAVAVLVIGSLVAMSQVVDCQFFTKSSQKSIPRMGRRSIDAAHSDVSSLTNINNNNNNNNNDNLNPYRRALIDALVDEFGPDLVELMRPPASASESKAKQMTSSAPQQDIVLDRDENQLEFNELGDFIRGRSLADALNHDYDLNQLSRNERAPNNNDNPGTKAQRQPNYKDASLALRALSANRYLKHLGSGQPLVTYDSFLNSKSQRRQEQQQQT